MVKRMKTKDFEVERILAKKVTRGTTMYKVRWFGYPPSEDTWEPLQNLGNLGTLINEFEAQHTKPVGRPRSVSPSQERSGTASPASPRRKKPIPGTLNVDEIERLVRTTPRKTACEVAWKQRRTGERVANSVVSVDELRYRCPQEVIDLLQRL